MSGAKVFTLGNWFDGRYEETGQALKDDAMTKRRDDMLARIVAYNEVKRGGVVIQRAAKGYSLLREDNGKPSHGCAQPGAAIRSRSCGGAIATDGIRSGTSAR